MSQEFRVPELGENVESATLAKLLISKGGTIKKEQAVVELETDKAVLEVPSDLDGTVDEILVQVGDEVKVGQALFTVKADAEPIREREPAAGKNRERPARRETAKPAEHGPDVNEAPGANEAGEAGGARTQRAGKAQPIEVRVPLRKAEPVRPVDQIPAAPSVHRFSREIGVDIREVAGSGPDGRISIEDVKTHARGAGTGLRPGAPLAKGSAAPLLPDFAQWGEVDRVSMGKVRRLTADRMSYASSVIPHVTQFGRADVTEMESLRQKHKEEAEMAGGRLTLMVLLIKTVAGALKIFPRFNASVDMERHEIWLRKYVNIGIAMDTERGLVVPVIRNADQKDMLGLSVDLRRIADKARDGKLAVEDMRGGCFTISNAGALGGDLFTPVVNWPEVAILGMAQARTEATYRNGAFLPRLILPLALSFDHRVIDGADAVRFLRWIIEVIENPVKFPWEVEQ